MGTAAGMGVAGAGVGVGVGVGAARGADREEDRGGAESAGGGVRWPVGCNADGMVLAGVGPAPGAT